MKKTLSIILITILFINIGCKKREEVKFDHKSQGWKLWVSGAVDKTYIKIEAGRKTFFIDFENNIEFKARRFHNFCEIQEKTKGSIYKWEDNWYRYYMWVPDNDFISTVQTPVSTIVTKSKINNTEISMPPTKYEWQNAKSKQPSFDQTVIVKFKNGLITIAYYERPCIWKAEIDRNKLSGGIALKNIVQWKLVDLK